MNTSPSREHHRAKFVPSEVCLEGEEEEGTTGKHWTGKDWTGKDWNWISDYIMRF